MLFSFVSGAFDVCFKGWSAVTPSYLGASQSHYSPLCFSAVSMTWLYWAGNRDSSCFTQGKSLMSSNIRMDAGVCIYAAEGAVTTLGMGIESKWQQPADNPCGELVGLERRQLGIISKIPCALLCPPFKLCFLCHPLPSKERCCEASSTHASMDPELSNCR